MDRLEKMLTMQQKLQKELGYDFSKMTDQQITAYIKEYTLHCDHELHEMLQELPYFKPWKNYTGADNFAMFTAAAEEFIDAWHFFMNIALAFGMDAEMFYGMYCTKNGINYERQTDKENYKRCVEAQDDT